MAQIAKKTKRYPSDLTDEEWDRLAPLMPKPGRRGRPREVDFREVINVVRYLVRSGCGWRMLPIHFGAWQTVYGWFRELARRFLFQTIHDIELMLDHERQGREASPSAAVIDSQSVKAPSAEKRGFDAGKKVVGRKRHIAVDTDGRLLMVNLTTADISDSAGAQTILDGIRKRWPWIKHLFADGAYDPSETDPSLPLTGRFRNPDNGHDRIIAWPHRHVGFVGCRGLSGLGLRSQKAAVR